MFHSADELAHVLVGKLFQDTRAQLLADGILSGARLDGVRHAVVRGTRRVQFQAISALNKCPAQVRQVCENADAGGVLGPLTLKVAQVG